MVPLGVILVVAAVFSPSLRNGFVNWDDQFNLTDNPHYRGLGWANLRWMFTTFHAGPYQPLTWVTLGADYLIWGMDPRGYHLTSLVWHAATVLAFYFLALRVIRLVRGDSHENSLPLRLGAAVAALLFGVHPLRVESVAWATERRDVVSGLFFILTLLAYLKACRPDGQASRRRWFALSLLAYAASLLGKGIGITLPILLIVLDVYPLRRLRWVAGRFVAGEGEFGPGMSDTGAGRHSDENSDPCSTPFVSPTAEAMGSPRAPIRRIGLEKLPFLILAVLAGAVGVWGQVGSGAVATLDQYGVERRIGVGLYATAFYLLKTILPVGLSPLYPMPQEVDLLTWRYLLSGGVLFSMTIGAWKLRHRWSPGLAIWVSYLVMLAPVSGLAQMGPQVAADRYTYLPCLGWAMLGGSAFRWSWERAAILSAAIGAVVIATLGGLTFRQCTVWHDSVSLWHHAVAIYPRGHLIHQNLGAALAEAGDHEGALEHWREAARLAPQSPEAHNNIGSALIAMGRAAEAEKYLRRAIELKPTHGGAHHNLANALVRLGKPDEAIGHYRSALRYRPDLLVARFNLADLLERQGQTDQAEVEWRAAIEQDPRTALIYDRLATLLSRQERYNEALEVLRRGVTYCPNERALSLRLAWLLATVPDERVRNPAEALSIAERLVERSDGFDPHSLDVLAAACAAAGRTEDAVKFASRAVELAEMAGRVKLAGQIRERLQSYQAGRSPGAER